MITGPQRFIASLAGLGASFRGASSAASRFGDAIQRIYALDDAAAAASAERCRQFFRVRPRPWRGWPGSRSAAQRRAR